MAFQKYYETVFLFNFCFFNDNYYNFLIRKIISPFSMVSLRCFKAAKIPARDPSACLYVIPASEDKIG